ncbi:MAG: DUF2007 domain-containing protein [Verrucomicrobiota bacterium]
MNFELISDYDSAKIGLYKSVLENAGIPVIVKNWESSNITDVPIPALYPAIFVHTREDLKKGREILNSTDSDSDAALEDWVCRSCGETIERQFAECWKCQASVDA